MFVCASKKGRKLLKNGKGVRTPAEISKLKKELGRKPVPIGSWWEGELLGYVESRKRLFVPKYAELVIKSGVFAWLKERVDRGENLLLLDGDGPSLTDHPQGVVITQETLDLALNDTNRIFGHAYVIAALIQGLSFEDAAKKRKTDNE